MEWSHFVQGDCHWPVDGWLTKLVRASDSHLAWVAINIQGDCHWPIDGWLTKLVLASDCHLAWVAIFLK